MKEYRIFRTTSHSPKTCIKRFKYLWKAQIEMDKHHSFARSNNRTVYPTKVVNVKMECVPRPESWMPPTILITRLEYVDKEGHKFIYECETVER